MAESALEDIEAKKAGARKNSIREGCFSAFASGISDNFVIAFAKELMAQPFQIGILNAFPGLLSPFAQLYGSKLIETKSRKDVVLKFVFLQAFMWLPIAVLGILYILGFYRGTLPYFLILFFTLHAFFGGVTGSPWFSWMGDIVDEKERGKFFSKRNRITGSLGLLGFLIAALLLDYFKTKGYVLAGFAILFSTAFILRGVFALAFFRKQYDPGLSVKREQYYFTFWQFLKRNGNYAKFSLFMGFFHLGMTIAGPFFVVYMLQELKFSYITFMSVSLSATLIYLLLVPIAGKFSDKYGNKKLIFFASILFSIYPLFWIFIREPVFLILGPQLVAGVATAAFAIGTTNYIYDTVTPQRRALCVSYMNILVGFGVFFGSILGGFLLSFDLLDINHFFVVFMVSSFLRFIFSIAFIPRFSEIRTFEKTPSLIQHALHPFKLIQAQFVWITSRSKVKE